MAMVKDTLLTSLVYHRLPTAGQFQGEGGPETDIKIHSESHPGDQDTLNLQEMKKKGLAG